MKELELERLELPDEPGVYLFYGPGDELLYVGKSVSIRSRVSGHLARPRAPWIEEIRRIDFLVTADEAQALVTERSYIRSHNPRYNVRLRDDGAYPYIAVSLDEDFPRIYVTREKPRKGRAYWGPFSSVRRAEEILELLSQIYPFRSCPGREPGRVTGSPCLDYHIGRCGAPCVDYQSKEDYRAGIDKAMEFLAGRRSEARRELKEKMEQASKGHRFEQAALFRDRLRALERLSSEKLRGEGLGDVDLIAVAVEGDLAYAEVLMVRDGQIADHASFPISNEARSNQAEVLEGFLLSYYELNPSPPPRVLIGPELADRAELLSDVIAIEVQSPSRGRAKELVSVATKNASLALRRAVAKGERTSLRRAEALAELEKLLGLETSPMRIECYDASNLGASNTGVAMVVFEGGSPKKSDYRSFSIERDRPDDYAALSEALGRRVGAYEANRDLSPYDNSRDESFASRPDLILIDGGKGQLSASRAPLHDWLAGGVAVISIAKRLEEIFVPGRSEPLLLERDSAALQLLQRLRDEAHRFAIGHHRRRRGKEMTRSGLDKVPGVGPKRRAALIRHFGSPAKVKAASAEELAEVEGITAKLAGQIREHFERLDGS